MILSYPGGSGGNWVVKVLSNLPILTNTVNFHYNNVDRKNSMRPLTIVHETDVNKFDYLYSGESYFNFYINVLLKHFIHEEKIFDRTSYEKSFLTCVNTARYICEYDQIKKHIFLNFDSLVNCPEIFLNQINYLQEELNTGRTSFDDFIKYRDRFILTCVNPTNLYENFENMFWVCFVIGQLMTHNCVPGDFYISDPNNQDKCKEFARQNYHLCRLNNVHFFDTNVLLPEFS